LHARLSVWNRDQQRMFRQFVADVEWLVLDSNGRILLPKRYLRMAGIELDVTFIGMDSTIEIWAKGANECDNATPELGEALQNLME
jgi:MraZ protein